MTDIFAGEVDVAVTSRAFVPALIDELREGRGVATVMAGFLRQK